MISRRSLIGGMAALPATALRAQTPQLKIGMLLARRQDDPEAAAYLQAFRDGLAQRGWDLSRISWFIRWLAADAAEIEANVRAVVESRPAVIVALSSGYVRKAIERAGSIPIVFVAVTDPIGQGLVTNLAKPGGHLTGFGIEDASLGGKWVEYLKLMVPTLSRCTGLYNPLFAPAARTFLPSMRNVGGLLGIEVDLQEVADDAGRDAAIARFGGRRDAGIVFLPDAWMFTRRREAVAAMNAAVTLGIYYSVEYARAGGLIALGNNRVDLFRRAADYVDRIAKGADAGSLPVQMPDIYELSINARTARAQGIAVPPQLAALADEVIE
jgi:putative ABC transport system substrate-binding protein